MEEGQIEPTTKGTPQGGVISPILANIYLHYVLDLWFEKVVKRNCKGEAYLVRYIVMRRYLTKSQNISKYLCVS